MFSAFSVFYPHFASNSVSQKMQDVKKKRLYLERPVFNMNGSLKETETLRVIKKTNEADFYLTSSHIHLNKTVKAVIFDYFRFNLLIY